ncbi:hypothetical protein [Nitrospirillum sp. BR 11828]|uniref:hypothetical protein n=1 Tax=Nitrospirillum sp. BR 11828 TaxID=3104325 RepID=UPI002ACAF968|nr:hypothetical protein [Nitrospirillum sp. BR 11828]MDZ5650040.1 hypothetical protein [Nitrospirillum sp. BR 11828]
MSYLIALFNLRADADPAAYETWAKATDLPTVRALPSIGGFDLFRLNQVRGSDQAPPYQYIEVIRVDDADGFRGDVATDTMRKVAAEFRAFADNPLFVACDRIEP